MCKLNYIIEESVIVVRKAIDFARVEQNRARHNATTRTKIYDLSIYIVHSIFICVYMLYVCIHILEFSESK